MNTSAKKSKSSMLESNIKFYESVIGQKNILLKQLAQIEPEHITSNEVHLKLIIEKELIDYKLKLDASKKALANL